MYTRGDYNVLPADDTNLEVLYSTQDYIDVDTDNGVYVNQSATGEKAIHQFKDYVGSVGSATFEWNGQTDLDCSVQPVTLQIYNHNTNLWETIDTDSTTGANTDFTLIANVPDLTDYKDASNVTSCRVWQDAG